MAEQKQSKKAKKAHGSLLGKIGRPAKAGRRRSPHMISTRDRQGKRQWETAKTPRGHKTNPEMRSRTKPAAPTAKPLNNFRISVDRDQPELHEMMRKVMRIHMKEMT